MRISDWSSDVCSSDLEADAHWQVSKYRGQNANMHACEALLAAYEATGAAHFLERAATLAEHMTRRQAALAGGDRKSVVSGKSVSVRVDLGGRRSIKKKSNRK